MLGARTSMTTPPPLRTLPFKNLLRPLLRRVLMHDHLGVHPISGTEVWEGDERRELQLSESADSLNGPDLFGGLPFL